MTTATTGTSARATEGTGPMSMLSGITRQGAEADLTEPYAAHRLALVRLATLLVDDRASAEDAEACGISRGSVKSTASRALDALEKIMDGESR